MAMITQHLQGACSTFPSVSSSWSRGSKVNHILPTFHPVGRKDRLISLKCRSRSSVGAAVIHRPKQKIFKIYAFKGGNRYDDSSSRTNGSKSIKNSAKVSFLQDESEESSLKSSKVHDVVPDPCTSAAETASRSVAIQKLFKNWLMLLRTQPQTEPVERAAAEPSSTESSETPNTVAKQETIQLVKAAAAYLMNLDATIKIPVLILTPMFFYVNIAYGSEVLKELAPLWILGPLIVALYIKIFRAICRLYVFSFTQTVKIAINMPSYCLLAYAYIFKGGLKETMRARLVQPLVDIKNKDYKEAARRKFKDVQEWMIEYYLDFIEGIWPLYCRTIRFLKRANLL
ncbi:uncharacterized protein LOC127242648 [Andrographis paniculata]|uniref:uncharacterized protein LOC127242648 n=1 Tax=Andrographis paniculata TaxID=175694 RepID=UPI0021E99C8C|nr:uncharacterized protein LOC127242648 [Andrographis paniculata]XP_051118229.1 uncharacterized protein LOC127242648 [Andrographis paniculata]